MGKKRNEGDQERGPVFFPFVAEEGAERRLRQAVIRISGHKAKGKRVSKKDWLKLNRIGPR